jgi:hypothetical protein
VRTGKFLRISEPESQKSFKNRALRARNEKTFLLQEENPQKSPREQKMQTPPK